MRARELRALEIALIVVVVSITCLLHAAPNYKAIVLNIYFLPVTLGGFFLGRYRAGVLALLAVLAALVATVPMLSTEAWILELLAIAVWGAVLGLAALVIGTLSEERTREFERLHETHMIDTLSDPLTGVANRRAFEYELSRRIAERDTDAKPLALILVDVDHFKKFNDTYGHRAGDAVLKEVGDKLVSTVRSSDMVSRYGGEEFAIILPDADSDITMQIGERIRSEIAEKRYTFENQVMQLTVSVGAAQAEPDENGSALLERADTAMYTSKQAGRNCSHFHNGTHCEHFGSSVAIRTSDNEQVTEDSDAYTDSSTGLPSRKVFIEELRRRVNEANRYKGLLSLAIVSLDDVCVQPGETSLDNRALTILAEFLRNHMRTADLVTRFDCREFATLMPSTPLSGAYISLERLRQKIELQYGAGDSKIHFTISVGIADLLPSEDTSSLLDRCSRALAQAQEDGGNRVVTNLVRSKAPSSGISFEEGEPSTSTSEPASFD